MLDNIKKTKKKGKFKKQTKGLKQVDRKKILRRRHINHFSTDTDRDNDKNTDREKTARKINIKQTEQENMMEEEEETLSIEK